jgi:hypothetical protein
VARLLAGGQTTGASKSAKVAGTSYATVSVAPAWVQSEELNNGKKRPVAQFGTSIQIPVLFSRVQSVRTYFESESVFSTDAKDANSLVEAMVGLEHNLSRHHYVPFHIETKLLGNQVLDTLSSVTSGGFRTLTPWGYRTSALYNSVYQIPLGPIWRFDTQFERRINRLPEQRTKYPNQSAVRFYGEMGWTPIRLLPGDATSNTLYAEFNLKGWLLPWDRRNGEPSKNRLEGLAEISLVIPITPFALQAGGLVAADPKALKQRIRVKYSIGAQEAQDFIHSRSLSIGIEAIK